ncbi:hypothetical protein [Nocardia thraciensis]
MRGTVVTAVFLGVVGGCLAAAGPASAVSEPETCAAVKTAVNDFSAKHDAAHGSDPAAMAGSSALWSELGANLDGVAATADEGKVKTALSGAVAQVNRAAAAPDGDRQALLDGPEFRNSMAAVDTACGF